MSRKTDTKPLVIWANSVKQLEERIGEALKGEQTPTLGIVFCSVAHNLAEVARLFAAYNIEVFGASSSGEIADDKVYEESITTMLLYIDHDYYKLKAFDAHGMTSYQAGQGIGKWAKAVYDLPALMIMSAGLRADGEQIINGITDEMGYQVPLFGGLAGDDLRMQGTFVFSSSQVISDGMMVLIFDRRVIELYGMAVSGWKAIGTSKLITRATGNVVYTIDDQPALEVYNRYLGVTGISGDHTLAAEYPLQVEREDGSCVLRAAMVVNEDKSMVYAGTVPEGAIVRFTMPPGFEVIDCAIEEFSAFNQQFPEADAIVLYSCKARHLALGPMVEDEISAIRKLWGVPLVGFFTYGEIGPCSEGRCDFHNDTVCLVLIRVR
jgi:hypothetical protein